MFQYDKTVVRALEESRKEVDDLAFENQTLRKD